MSGSAEHCGVEPMHHRAGLAAQLLAEHGIPSFVLKNDVWGWNIWLCKESWVRRTGCGTAGEGVLGKGMRRVFVNLFWVNLFFEN